MAPPKKDSFKINSLEAPTGHWNGSYDDFTALGDNVDPVSLKNAATPYLRAQGMFITTYEELTTQAYRLVDAWQGDASAEFQKNLQALYTTACNLADAHGKVGIAMGYQADDLETLQENVAKLKPDESFLQHVGDAALNPVSILGATHVWNPLFDGQQQANDAAGAEAKKWMNNDLTHSTTTYTYGELPTDVHTETPNPTLGRSNPPTLLGGGGGGAGGVPHMTTPHPSSTVPHPTTTTPHPTTTTPHPTTTTPHGATPTPHPTTPTTPTTPHGTNLAGFHPGGGLGGGGLGGGGLGSGGLGGGGLGGGGLGSGGLGAGAGGLDGVGGLGGSLAAEEAAAARNAALAAKGGTTGGMPMGMGGAGHGGQEEERERTTWLTEDEDIWGGDGDVAPPVIG
jgi:uncharacterized protein YukE